MNIICHRDITDNSLTERHVMSFSEELRHVGV